MQVTFAVSLMRMKYIALSLLLLIGCSRQPEQFPELIPTGGLPEGYSWELSNGPDFYVYHGVGANSNAGVGIYFGMHPDPGNEQPVRTERGAIGPVSVQWDILDGSTDCRVTFCRRCITAFRASRKHKEIVLHAWVFADTESEVKALQQSLEGLTFEETTYEERLKRGEQPSAGDVLEAAPGE